MLIFYLIHLKNHPGLYIGKRSPTHALYADYAINIRKNYTMPARYRSSFIDMVRYWVQPEEHAKVWTSAGAVRKFRNLGTTGVAVDVNGNVSQHPFCPNPAPASPTYDEYEVVTHNGNVTTITPLTTF